MNNNYFHKKIKDTIRRCSYEFYVVHPIEEIVCPCVIHATKQADPKCQKCLGTGCKIKIKKMRGASNEMLSNIGASRTMRGGAVEAEGRTYFIDEKYTICRNDIIIDNEDVLIVYRKPRMKAMEGELTHVEIEAIPVRNNSAILYKNFKTIMKRYKESKK